VLLDDLQNFKVRRVFLAGVEVARDGVYLPPVQPHSIEPVTGSFHVQGFSADKLRMHLTSDSVHVIGINPGSVVTSKLLRTIHRDETGDFLFDPAVDIAKIAVVERHQDTGNVALGLLEGYGIKRGAVALSIAHDSHNIIAVGVSNDELAFAVQQLIAQNGGMVLVRDGQVLESLPLPVAGLMSDQSGEWVDKKLASLHETAHRELEISSEVEPVMTLCFMSLAVIPEIKLTDMGLFDVTSFDFITVEAAESEQTSNG
jgi:adenine deaminase